MAALLFVAGLREFSGAPPLRAKSGLLIVAAALGAESLVATQAGDAGRHAMLDLQLGLLYTWLAVGASRARLQVERALARPLRPADRAGRRAGGDDPDARRGHRDARRRDDVRDARRADLLRLRVAGQRAAGAGHPVDRLRAAEQPARRTGEPRPADRALNRSGLEEGLARHFGARARRPLTALALDLDHFKRVNDTHGHAAGDEVLRAVSAALSEHVRPGDLVARTGGEEFAIYCQTGDPGVAQALAERLRQEVQGLAITAPGLDEPIRCTVSIGISRPFDTLAGRTAAEAQADSALYAAKALGRDRVVAA
ncbi:MAG: GGDEF domain-containing protein [Comamonadaceae bacterium]|nr:GGDEF domain-containing protein [Comamonadaceae bacterium]